MTHQFRVWAPGAHQVEIELYGPLDTPTTPVVALAPGLATSPGDPDRVLPMLGTEDGWWELTVDDAGPGTGYLYRVDGGPGRPDPRSPWQPQGVHGPSRVVDHSAFPWTDGSWDALPLADAVIYEAHVGTFSPAGTFLGAIEHLDDLVDLGVTHLELMPIAAFSGRWGWGYDGVDLYAPHPAYGTPDELKALVDAAHARGLAVLVDCVYNHLGPAGNYLAAFGPYFTDKYATPWGDAVNVDDAGSTEVRRFIVDNALMWMRDHHVDGLRLDAVHAIIDTSAVHILEQLSAEVAELAEQLGRRLVLIAESDRNDPRMLQPRDEGGLGIDAHWNDDFHHAVHVALTDEQDSYYVDYGGLEPLAEALRHAYVYRGQYSEFRDRHHGREPEGVPGDAFVAYVQNHDQIGNRARGERASHLVSTDRLKIAAAVVLTSPFVPMLFQGEEWAASAPFPYFADHEDDPDLADAVRKGRLDEFATFGWEPDEVADPESPETFASAVLDRFEQQREPHASVLAWYRSLLSLRQAEHHLSTAERDHLEVALDDARGVLVYRRGDLVVALNLGERDAAVTVPAATGSPELLLASNPDIHLTDHELGLPPDSVAVLRS